MDDVLRTAMALFDSSLPEAMLSRCFSSDANPRGVYLPGYPTSAITPQNGDGGEPMRVMTALYDSGVDNIVISRWPVNQKHRC